MPSEIHPATWRFLRGIHREGYAPRPELTLTDWLSDRRRAHAALLGEDIQIDRMLAPATLEGLRDRALLSVLLQHGLRREELCLLTVRDIHARRGVPHLRVHGKGGKTRYLPLHPGSAERIHAYLEAAGHGGEPAAPQFQPAKRRQGATRGAAITADGVYNCVLAYAAQAKIAIDGFGVHSLRATAATNALEHEADLAKVQEWLATRTSRPRGSTTDARAAPKRFADV